MLGEKFITKMNSKMKRKKEARDMKKMSYHSSKPFRRDPPAKTGGQASRGFTPRKGSYASRGFRYTDSQGKSIKISQESKVERKYTPVK